MAATAQEVQDFDSVLTTHKNSRPKSVAIAEFVLRQLDEPASATKPMRAEDIFKAAQKLGISVGMARGTFQTALSQGAKQIGCPVASAGPGRGGGYFLSVTAQAVTKSMEQEQPQSDKGAEQKRYEIESLLYPALQRWLISRDYKAKITAAMKSLGRWGNPDVTGLLIDEHLGQVEIEVATIEAKADVGSWQVDFFQAVSHKRFANRVYFAFPLPEETSEQFDSELRYYSERFGVGVLVLVMDNELFARYTERKLTKEDKDAMQAGDLMEVREVLSAPWDRIPLGYQREFCTAVGIEDLKSLMTWGADADE